MEHGNDQVLIVWGLRLVWGRRLRNEGVQARGYFGVITIKIMINTNNTSIIGVILISARGLPEPPSDIEISVSCVF